MNSPVQKIYLGDGAYAEIVFGDLVLTTSNGVTVTNRIVLGADGWEALQQWIASLTPKHQDRDE